MRASLGAAAVPALLRACVLAFALLASATPAFAHAEIVRSEPAAACGPRAAEAFAGAQSCPGGSLLTAAPEQVRLVFSEPVSPVAGGIVVRAPSGQRVDRGPARAAGAELSVPVEATELGTYQVTWRVVADDTHPARGGFTFSLGRSTAGTEPSVEPGVDRLGLLLEVTGRWLHFLGYALGFGTLAFGVLVGSTGAGRLAGGRLLDDATRLGPLVSLGVALMVLAVPVALAGQLVALGGEPLDGEVIADAVSSTFGRALGLRLAGALLLWTLLGILRERPDRRLGWCALGLGLALAVADGASAHASGFRPPALGLLVNGLHVAAMGLWVGGLIALIVRTRAGREDVGHAAGLSIGALAVLALTGAAMALVHLDAPVSVLTTGYGLALLAKLLVVAAALALALAARRRPASAARWRLGEAAALLIVLALAGSLVSLPPPR